MKKVISILVLTVLLLGTFAVGAFATEETVTAAGFYGIGSEEGVTITPVASIGEVKEISAKIGDDYETFFANSDKLNVTYEGAVDGAYYGIILVEGTELPTKDNTIFYINQLTATSGTINTEVYPALPDERTVLTLYISCSDETKDLVSVVLNYTPEGTFDVKPEYVLGDADANEKIEIDDAVLTLQFIAGLKTPIDNQKQAADVDCNEVVEIDDALMILQYVAGLRSDWN